ncbi:unnamed protein product, partial [Prunus armeniaca]
RLVGGGWWPATGRKMASVAGRKLAAAGGGDWQEYGCCGWPAGAGPTMGGWPEGGLLEVLLFGLWPYAN